MDEKDELLELYLRESDLLFSCYEMMGRLLDKKQIEKRVKELELKKIYIYGGGFLGLQLYRAVENLLTVIAVVDKSGGLIHDLPEIPVIDYERFCQEYAGETVIVTPMKHYQRIYEDLSQFIPKEKIMFLGEFQGGE